MNKNIKQVSSFQTNDGKLHSNRAEALNHQLQLDLRGIIQSNLNQVNITPSQAAAVITKNIETVKELLSRYSYSINRIKKPAAKVS